MIRRAAENGNAMQKHAARRKRIIKPEEDRYVSLMAKKNRNATPNQIPVDLANAITTGTHIA